MLAIQPHDGKVLWKTEVGTFRQGQQFFYYYMRDTVAPAAAGLPRGAIYVDTHVGVLARLDADSGALDWGYGYQTDARFSRAYRFFYYDHAAGAEAVGGHARSRPARRS